MDPRPLPLFRLPEARGGEAGTADAFQRRPCVVALLHAQGCPPCDAALGALEAGPDEGASVYVVGLGERAAARGVSVLRDADGHVAERLARTLDRPPGEPVLVASDRYGEIAGAWPVHGQAAERLVEEALDAVRFVEQQCPE